MFVTNSLTGGGAERSMNLVCNELFRRGWPIALVPINSGPPDQVTPLCEVFPLERQWKSGPLNTLQAMVQFNQIVKSWKPDVVVLNCDLPELFGATLCRSQKFIVLEHSSTPWAYRKFMGILIRKILSIRRTKWAAVSPHLSIWPSDKKPLSVLPNPITPFSEKQPYDPGDEIRRLVFIGRLSPEKRPSVVIEISERSRIPLVIIGEGSLKNQLEEEAADRQVDVIFKGHMLNPWIEIKGGDLLIVPSEFEGDGLVAIEAMQYRVPILLADIEAFQRFDLPDRWYFKDTNEFVHAISKHSNRVSTFLIPQDLATFILKSRSIKIIGSEWEKILESV